MPSIGQGSRAAQGGLCLDVTYNLDCNLSLAPGLSASSVLAVSYLADLQKSLLHLASATVFTTGRTRE